MTIKLGFMIDHFRKARGMTLDEVGEMLDKTPSTISRWISGSRSPKVEDLIKLTKLFNTDVSTLLYGDDALVKNKYYKFYADDVTSLNIEHFLNLNNEHFLQIPLSDIVMGENAGKNLVITKLYDASLDAVIPVKSFVAIDSNKPIVKNNDIIMCSVNNQIMFRRYFVDDGDRVITLKSETVSGGVSESTHNVKDVLILGKVVGALVKF